ncbi:MAG: SHOCT-like domain-containing protein [Halanaerobiaceae bacterium]
MDEERMRVLKMVEEGKIGTEEANDLLAALEGNAKEDIKKEEVKARKKKIKIYVEEKGNEKVNITIPLKLAKLAVKLIPRSAQRELKEQEDINIKEILDAIEDELMEEPTLVNVNDKEKGVRVIIKVV